MNIKIWIAASLFCGAITAQDTALTEKEIPKKVLQTRNKKTTALKNKETTWSKNAAGEFVARREIGAAIQGPPDQTITARFAENGTLVETETVLSPVNDKIKNRLVPRNIQAACKKKGEPALNGGVTILEASGKYTLEAGCGEKRITFDKKAKILKEE